MTANEKQIGGDHYKSTYEVWDFSIDALQDRFFETTICKYVARHSKKDGVKDLDKAQHYAEKLLELFTNHRIACMCRERRVTEVRKFVKANELGEMELKIIEGLTDWYSTSDLVTIIHRIKVLKNIKYDINF